MMDDEAVKEQPADSRDGRRETQPGLPGGNRGQNGEGRQGEPQMLAVARDHQQTDEESGSHIAEGQHKIVDKCGPLNSRLRRRRVPERRRHGVTSRWGFPASLPASGRSEWCAKRKLALFLPITGRSLRLFDNRALVRAVRSLRDPASTAVLARLSGGDVHVVVHDLPAQPEARSPSESATTRIVPCNGPTRPQTGEFDVRTQTVDGAATPRY